MQLPCCVLWWEESYFVNNLTSDFSVFLFRFHGGIRNYHNEATEYVFSHLFSMFRNQNICFFVWLWRATSFYRKVERTCHSESDRLLESMEPFVKVWNHQEYFQFKGRKWQPILSVNSCWLLREPHIRDIENRDCNFLRVSMLNIFLFDPYPSYVYWYISRNINFLKISRL